MGEINKVLSQREPFLPADTAKQYEEKNTCQGTQQEGENNFPNYHAQYQERNLFSSASQSHLFLGRGNTKQTIQNQ